MIANEEGFLQPCLDKTRCVNCGLCEKVCPGLKPARKERNNPRAFIVQHKDDFIRYQSTSGGAFTALAEEVIRRGGVVFGAIMNDQFRVVHGAVETFDDLSLFRNSKYVQSEIGDSYIRTKDYLKQNRLVCFSGTPCQINGLIKYLGRDYDNLITVDVVCKSVPSPLIFKKYIEYKKEKEGNLTDVVFRDKKRGFLYCTMAHYLSHEDRRDARAVYRRGSESDEWLRLFLSGRISRLSCISCSFQTTQRVADFTLGDIWETGNTKLDDNKGSTLVHVWSEKGFHLFEAVKSNINWIEYPFELSRGKERTNTIPVFQDRAMLFSDSRTLAPHSFFSKYAPYTAKIILKEFGRNLIWRLHLHNLIRHIKHLIIHR